MVKEHSLVCPHACGENCSKLWFSEKEVQIIFEKIENEIHREKKRLFKVADKNEKQGNKQDMRSANHCGMTLGINAIRIVNKIKKETLGVK